MYTVVTQAKHHDKGNNMSAATTRRPKVRKTPGAEVQTLVRGAKRLMGQADRVRDNLTSGFYDSGEFGTVAEAQRDIADLQGKAKAKLQRAIALNEEHGLGYPVHSGMLP